MAPQSTLQKEAPAIFDIICQFAYSLADMDREREQGGGYEIQHLNKGVWQMVMGSSMSNHYLSTPSFSLGRKRRPNCLLAIRNFIKEK